MQEKRWIEWTLALVVAAFVLRLGGVGAGWLPSPRLMFALALAAAVAAWGLQQGGGAISSLLSRLDGRGFALGLTALAVLALVIQLVGLDVGIGQSPLDIDEHRLASTVREFFVSGQVPHETVEDYPGVVYWLVAGVYLMAYLFGLISERIDHFNGLSMDSLVLIGRHLNAALYAGTVLVVGLLARRCVSSQWGRVAGLGGAALMAFSSMGVTISGQFRNEAGVLLLSTIAVLCAVEVAAGASSRMVFAAGVFAGLAAGVKYTGVFALLPVLGAVLFCVSASARLRALGVAVAAFVAAFAISNPFPWLDFPNFVEQLGVEVRMTGAGHWSATDNPQWFYSDRFVFSYGLPMVLAAAGATVAAFVRPLQPLRLVLLFAIPYQLFMTSRPAQFERWVYPLLPAFVVLAVWMLVALAELRTTAPVAWRGKRLSAAVALLILAILVPAATSGAALVVRRSKPSTYTVTSDWLRDNLPEDALVAVPDRWLEASASGSNVFRTGSLPDLLTDGPLRPSAFDWVVVPEDDLPLIRRLGWSPVIEFHAGSRFGRLGHDIAVFEGPEPPAGVRSLELDLEGPRARQYLGDGWTEAEAGRGRAAGREAMLILPLRRQEAHEIVMWLSWPASEQEEVPRPFRAIRVNQHWLDGKHEVACASNERFSAGSSPSAEDEYVIVRCSFAVRPELLRARPNVLVLVPEDAGWPWIQRLWAIPTSATPAG